jgi:BirA family biotin operon repressor/biotin-[acetyl-CoA-carboxylase] ligase
MAAGAPSQPGPRNWPRVAGELSARLASDKGSVSVEVVPEIASTNTELMRRARAGACEPVLLVAEHQSAGRGRLGRGWSSRPGESLTFSLGLPLAPADWAGMSLAAGVAIAEALDPRVMLKWPNDLWVGDRKLAGILIETATFGADAQAGTAPRRYAVIGVGINILPREAEGLSTPPAALTELLDGTDPGETLLRVAPPLVESLRLFEAHGFQPFQARFQARDLLRDRAVVLSDGTEGTAHGVSGEGGLLVHTAAGMQVVTSAEVSVRPRR